VWLEVERADSADLDLGVESKAVETDFGEWLTSAIHGSDGTRRRARQRGRGQALDLTAAWFATLIPIRPVDILRSALSTLRGLSAPLIPPSPRPSSLSVMPKSVPKSADKKTRHQPLHVEIDQDNDMAKYGRVSQPGKRRRSRKNEDEREDEVRYRKPASAPWSIHSTLSQEVFDSKTSKKIIQLARDQQEELALREELDVGEQEATT